MPFDESINPVDAFDQYFRNILACCVLCPYDNESGICLNERGFLWSTIANIFVPADGNPTLFSNKMQPLGVSCILWQVIVMHFTRNSSCT